MIEAAAKGASTAISLVANVAAMLITFFAFIAFFNAILSYLGSMVEYPELSFQASFFYFFSTVVERIYSHLVNNTYRTHDGPTRDWLSVLKCCGQC